MGLFHCPEQQVCVHENQIQTATKTSWKVFSVEKKVNKFKDMPLGSLLVSDFD